MSLASTGSTGTRRFCTFRLDKFLFGIGVERVQEVLRYQEMTCVPLAAKEIKGLINLRGQIVTAIDLRSCLGMPERAPDARPMNIILRWDGDGGGLSLLVDAIEDVVDVQPSTFEPPPHQLSGTARQLVRGVFKLDARLLLELDAERAVQLSNRGRTQEV